MTAWQLFIAADMMVTAAVAFYAGYLLGRERGYERGFRAGTARGGRHGAHYFSGEVDPTAPGARR